MSAIPRPASTVVLIDDLSRVYLTKRPITMKFMGGFHVFPGGGVDNSDYVINRDFVHTESQNKSLSHAHYIAAARELFEEVGILLANKMDGSSISFSREKTEKYRQQLLHREISFNDILEQERLNFDFQCLSYIGQLITPVESPIRFDTHFFLTKLPKGQVPDPDETEIDGAFWISPEEALAVFDHKNMKLAPPTIICLQSVIEYQQGGALKMSNSESNLLELLKKLKK